MKKKISVVIPVYNSQNTIEEVVNRVNSAIEKIPDLTLSEIILINDCSPDSVLDVCKNLAETNSEVRVLNLSRNFGQHNALMAGFSKATGDYIVALDDDLQTLPEEIHKLYSKLIEDDYDIVFAKYADKEHNSFRKFGSKANEKMARWLVSQPKDIEVTSFYIMKRFLMEEMLKYKNAYPYIAGLVFRVTKNAANITVEHAPRQEGGSNYNLGKLLRLWLNGFTGFSVKPLRICTFTGFVAFALGILLIILLVIQRIVRPDMELGWTSTIVTIVFFGSIQLISIGILGEYIGRTFLSINNAPQYVIKNEFGKDKED